MTRSPLYGTEVDNETHITSYCTTCLIPLKINFNVESATEKYTTNIRDAISLAKDRLKLYVGHVQRAVNEDRRISTVMDSLRKSKPEFTVLMIVDYKMKFEPICFGETSTDFFGKRGMSWHGSVIFYRRKESFSGDDGLAGGHNDSNFFYCGDRTHSPELQYSRPVYRSDDCGGNFCTCGRIVS